MQEHNIMDSMQTFSLAFQLLEIINQQSLACEIW